MRARYDKDNIHRDASATSSDRDDALLLKQMRLDANQREVRGEFKVNPLYVDNGGIIFTPVHEKLSLDANGCLTSSPAENKKGIEKPSYWPMTKDLTTSAIFRRLKKYSLYNHYLNDVRKQQYDYVDKEGRSVSPDDFGNTLRGTQLDGYFNRTSENSKISFDLFKLNKTQQFTVNKFQSEINKYSMLTFCPTLTKPNVN